MNKEKFIARLNEYIGMSIEKQEKSESRSIENFYWGAESLGRELIKNIENGEFDD